MLLPHLLDISTPARPLHVPLPLVMLGIIQLHPPKELPAVLMGRKGLTVVVKR